MKISTFVKAIRQQYSTGFIFGLTIFIILTLIPIVALSITNKIAFDHAEFANLYLSTIFTSVLIGLTLQFFEFYRIILTGHKKIHIHLQLIKELLEKCSNDIGSDDHTLLKTNGHMLDHYRNSIFSLLSSDKAINEALIIFYNRTEFLYIIECLKYDRALNQNEKSKLENHIIVLSNELLNLIKTV